MNILFKIVWIAVFLIMGTRVYSDPQNPQSKLDSLVQLIEGSVHDTIKGKAMNDLAHMIYYSDLDSSFSLCVASRKLAQRNLANKQLNQEEELAYKKIMAVALIGIGYAHLQRAENQEALKISEEAIVYLEEVDDKKGLGVSWSNIGVVYKDFGDFAKSLDAYSKSLKFMELAGDENGKATTLLNIGYVYAKQGDYPMAIKYDSLAMGIWRELGEERGMAVAFNNMAANYGKLGQGDKVIEFYKKSLTISEKYKHKKGMATALGNLGDQYLKMDSLNKAEEMYLQAGELYQKMKNNRFLSRYLDDMARLNLKKGDLKTALAQGQESLKLAESTGFPAEIRNAAFTLSKVYQKLGDWENAYNIKDLYTEMRDSVKSMENEKATIKSQYRFTYEKQALSDSLKFAGEQAVLVAQSEKQKIGLFAAVGGLFLLLALAYSIYSGKKKSDELLLNILPAETADELKRKGHSEARLIDEVTVLFTDFKGFTAMSEQLSPKDLVDDLNICFSEFDRIMEKYGIEKIKTIGDAYMAASGLPTPNDEHAQNIVKAAFEMRDFVEAGKARKIEKGLPYFEIRIGIHTGPVVAGIVGIKKFQYDIWGDTVNTASRMESSGEVGKVNVSESTYELVKDEFTCEHRGKIEAKGKGKIDMYFVESKA